MVRPSAPAIGLHAVLNTRESIVMTYTRINDELSVSSQIYPDDIERIIKSGFRSIICNRPDGETPDQPDFVTIASHAKQAGLEALYIPVTPGEMHEKQVNQFAEALRTLPGPILAYCRSGARSSALWKRQKELAENISN